MEEIKESEEQKLYKDIIKDYLLINSDFYSIKNFNGVTMKFKNLGGGMNKNYLVEITNRESKNNFFLFFRYFGDITNEFFDKKREVEIMKKLSKKGYGPKLLDFDYENEKYRIDEFLEGSRELYYEEIFNEDILEKLIIIINKYSQITDIYKYELIEEEKESENTKISKKIIKIIQEGNNSFKITNNIYDNIINKVYPTSKENFEKFYADYTNNSKIVIENDILKESNINKIKELLNNFKNIFSTFFNNEGYFVLNHHDLYQVNILLNPQTNKMYLIDNEFACLSMIGFDIIWYLLMSLFKYYPNYEYFPNLMNYVKFYDIFIRYLECFEKENSLWINENEERKKYIETLKKERYFCELLCIANLFSFIFGLADLQFEEEFIKKSTPPFFTNVLNRIQLFEYSYKKYQSVQ